MISFEKSSVNVYSVYNIAIVDSVYKQYDEKIGNDAKA